MPGRWPVAEFKWNGDDADAVILPHQPRTAVYSSSTGNVVVRQEADAMQENDDLIYLTPQGALAVAWALIEEAHLVGLPEASGSLMVESAHWPPVTKRFDHPGTMKPRYPDGPVPASDKAAPEPGPLLRAMQDAAE